MEKNNGKQLIRLHGNVHRYSPTEIFKAAGTDWESIESFSARAIRVATKLHDTWRENFNYEMTIKGVEQKAVDQLWESKGPIRDDKLLENQIAILWDEVSLKEAQEQMVQPEEVPQPTATDPVPEGAELEYDQASHSVKVVNPDGTEAELGQVQYSEATQQMSIAPTAPQTPTAPGMTAPVMAQLEEDGNVGPEEKKIVEAIIRKRGDEWCVLSKSGDTLGCHATKEEATKQLQAIEIQKHATKTAQDPFQETSLEGTRGMKICAAFKLHPKSKAESLWVIYENDIPRFAIAAKQAYGNDEGDLTTEVIENWDAFQSEEYAEELVNQIEKEGFEEVNEKVYASLGTVRAQLEDASAWNKRYNANAVVRHIPTNKIGKVVERNGEWYTVNYGDIVDYAVGELLEAVADEEMVGHVKQLADTDEMETRYNHTDQLHNRRMDLTESEKRDIDSGEQNVDETKREARLEQYFEQEHELTPEERERLQPLVNVTDEEIRELYEEMIVQDADEPVRPSEEMSIDELREWWVDYLEDIYIPDVLKKGFAHKIIAKFFKAQKAQRKTQALSADENTTTDTPTTNSAGGDAITLTWSNKEAQFGQDDQRTAPPEAAQEERGTPPGPGRDAVPKTQDPGAEGAPPANIAPEPTQQIMTPREAPPTVTDVMIEMLAPEIVATPGWNAHNAYDELATLFADIDLSNVFKGRLIAEVNRLEKQMEEEQRMQAAEPEPGLGEPMVKEIETEVEPASPEQIEQLTEEKLAAEKKVAELEEILKKALTDADRAEGKLKEVNEKVAYLYKQPRAKRLATWMLDCGLSEMDETESLMALEEEAFLAKEAEVKKFAEALKKKADVNQRTASKKRREAAGEVNTFLPGFQEEKPFVEEPHSTGFGDLFTGAPTSK